VESWKRLLGENNQERRAISPKAHHTLKKIGGRYRARVTTSPQVQNRMVEILRMCDIDLSNLDTAMLFAGQIILVQAINGTCGGWFLLPLSMNLEVSTKNWK